MCVASIMPKISVQNLIEGGGSFWLDVSTHDFHFCWKRSVQICAGCASLTLSVGFPILGCCVADGSQCGTPTRETFLSAAAETPMRRPYSRWNKENDDIVSATPRRLAKGQVTIGQVSRLLSSGAFFGSRLTGTNENEDGNSVVPFQQKVVLCTMLLLLQKRGRHSATLAEVCGWVDFFFLVLVGIFS